MLDLNQSQVADKPVVKSDFPSGLLFLLLAMLGNLVLGMLPIASILFVDKGEQLILGSFHQVDPAFTTILLIMQSMFGSLVLWFLLHYKFSLNWYLANRGEGEDIVKVVMKSLMLLIQLLPLLFWFLVLCFKIFSVENMREHMVSPLLCVVGMFLVVKLVNESMKSNSFSNQFDESESGNRVVKFAKDLWEYYNRVYNPIGGKIVPNIIFTAFAISFFFLLIKYGMGCELFSGLEDVLQNAKVDGFWLLRTIFCVLVCVFGCCYWMFRSHVSQRKAFVLYFLFAGLYVSSIAVGNIMPLDVLVVFSWCFGIFCTFLVVGLLYLLKMPVLWVIQNGKTPLKKVIVHVFTIVIFIMLIWGSYQFLLDEDEERSSFVLGESKNNSSTINLEDAISKWFINQDLDHTSHDTIYMFNGQGGGSKAGCTFYMAMDTLLNLSDKYGLGIDHIASLSTISGSSTGAQFFVADSISRSLGVLQDLSIKEKAKILYNRDYVSVNLFKMLITDWKLLRCLFDDNRNSSLLRMESNAFQELLVASNSFNPLTKSFVDIYKEKAKLPLFVPTTYNITKGRKAVSSPYLYNIDHSNTTCDVIHNQSNRTRNDLTLGEATLLSQLFPMITASATVNGESYMDGGVYDNAAFEVTEDLYRSFCKVRDSLAINVKIAVVSVLNAPIESDVEREVEKYDLVAAYNSALVSIFVSNLVKHRNELKNTVEQSGDIYYSMNCYNTISESNSESSFFDIFRITESDGIVMSRYLTYKEIEKISEYVHRESIGLRHHIDSLNNLDVKTVNVLFDFNEKTILEDQEYLLDSILKEENIIDSVVVTGYSDKINYKKSKRIALERAEAVKRYLSPMKHKLILRSTYSVGKHERIWHRQLDRKTELKIYYKK